MLEMTDEFMHGQLALLQQFFTESLLDEATYRAKLETLGIDPDIIVKYPMLFHEQLEALYAGRFAEIAERLGDDHQVKACEYALDRLSLSLVLQACGRGIRSETDQCAFVLLDRYYHKYGWRRFLDN